jgi:hypothetical protein
MAKGCLHTQYRITMWENIGVHDMDQTRPHKLQSPYIRHVASHNHVSQQIYATIPILSRMKDGEIGA